MLTDFRRIGRILESLSDLPPQILAMMIFFIVIFLVIQFIPRSKRKKVTPSQKRHAAKIKRSETVLERLKEIGIQDGRAAQFGYLRSQSVDEYVFEEMILTALAQRSIKIKRNLKYSGDGGIDGRFWIGSKQFYIQAKCYKDHIKASDVVKFGNDCSNDRVHGLFVHTGRTGLLSKTLKPDNIDIVSGRRLIDLLEGRPVSLMIGGDTKVLEPSFA